MSTIRKLEQLHRLWDKNIINLTEYKELRAGLLALLKAEILGIGGAK